MCPSPAPPRSSTIARRWRSSTPPSLDIWFEDGLETPGIALLAVTPVVAEFWEPAKGKVAMAAGALKALVTRDTPDDDIMNHGRVTC